MKKLHKKYDKHTDEEISRDFLKACTMGDIKTVKHLANYSVNEINSNLKTPTNTAFTQACMNGHKQIVKFLLTDSAMNRHRKVKTELEPGFIAASLNGHIDVIKFIWCLSHEKNQESLRINGVTAFFMALRRNNLELMHYLIFEVNIPRTKTMDEFLHIKPNHRVDNWFKLRDLNKKLNSDLSSTKVSKAKLKL